MTAIPVLPLLPAGYVVTESDMNNLASCVSFMLNKPHTRIHDAAGGQSITASATTPVAIALATPDYDADGMYSSGHTSRLTVQTPGFYKVRYGISVTCSASATKVNGCVLGTTGANNPAGSGVSLPDAWASFAQATTSTNVASCGASGVYPFYLWAGDYITIGAQWDGGTLVTSTTNGGSFLELEFVSV